MSKKQWGNACWYMFHTLAEKIKPQYVGDIQIILKLIINVCYNLPCPICSHHARNNIAAFPIINIVTKDQLKQYLCNLHNKVNSQLNKSHMTIDECNKIYKHAITYRIIGYFRQSLLRQSGFNLRMAVANKNKTIHVTEMLNYLNNNIHKFNP